MGVEVKANDSSSVCGCAVFVDKIPNRSTERRLQKESSAQQLVVRSRHCQGSFAPELA